MAPHHARLPCWGDKTPDEKLDALRHLTLDLYGYQFSQARGDVLALLAAHQPADEKEARDIERIKTLIEAHPNIFSMNCEVGHVTASAAIIEPRARRTLLHYHKRLGRWLQVGGHAEYETDFAQVALREAREETGLPDLEHFPPGEAPAPIDYDVHTIPQSGDAPEHLHLDFRYVLMTRQPEALAPAQSESTRFRWLNSAEMLDAGAAIDDSLRRLLRKAFALLPSEEADR
ncbi:MAG: NUDIX domain-containing protein [Chloroflexi bacterium]|nr:NUDIX domain-containing protein [Chloroflexota bacterium]